MTETRLSDEHYQAFGQIMYHYASAEIGFKLLITAMLDMDISTFMILSAPYSSRQLKDVVKSITKSSEFEHEEEAQKIISLTGDFQRFNRIRNYIAHNRWADGERPHSIKPVLVDIRSGKAIMKGYSEGEEDFTIDELRDFADSSLQLNFDINKFMDDYGYHAIIEEKISENSKRIDIEVG